MADNVNSKSMDSDKAALGRKLLNKHQKSKSTRGNGNCKPNGDNSEERTQGTTSCNDAIPDRCIETATTPILLSSSTTGTVTAKLVSKQQVLATPIQGYFSTPNNNSYNRYENTGEINFFDFDRVTLDDPELKHNEIFNLHQQNEEHSLSVVDPKVKCDPPSIENVGETSPVYDDITIQYSRNSQQVMIDSLQSQLQAQVLTNSQLLGENAQVHGELQHARLLITHHSDQIYEYKQRVEATEARLAESQRQLETSKRLSEEWRAKAEQEEHVVTNLRKERDIALQDASELLERLTHSQEDAERVKEVIGQLKSQLDMTNIRIQQLLTTNANAGADSTKTSEEDKEKELQLEKQLADMKVAVESVRAERDIAAQQYQLYNSQLNEQVGALQAEVLTLRSSSEQLAVRERDLVAHIGDMERLLQQNTQNNQNKVCDKAVVVASLCPELQELRQQYKQLSERLQESSSERDEALRELHQLQAAAEELQELRDTRQVDSAAQAKLLEEIRSDKVAASRAIEQNLILKAQVVEMEAAYLAVTQDKVAPLTDQLATAKHQLQGYERNLRILQDAVELKDRELEQMRVHEAQVAHLTDRLRHYEAHEHGTPSIQAELQQLRLENKRLLQDKLHHHHHEEDDEEEQDVECAADNDREDQLQQEIFRLKQQMDEMRRANEELEIIQQEQQYQQHSNHVENEDDGDCDAVGTRRLSKAKAIQQLEHKFTRTMAELAALNDEKQRLEHLVLQLQGETETIGEYVALYQRQRSLLSQRTAAREAQLRLLQERLAELASALEGGGEQRRVAQLLQEIRQSNTDLMQHNSSEVSAEGELAVAAATVACGGGCAWCQGNLITV